MRTGSSIDRLLRRKSPVFLPRPTVTERASSPLHAALRNVVFDDQGMVFAGRRVSDLAAEIGSTPFYAYDSSAIDARVAQLRAVLPAELHLHYAVKANPMPAVVEHLVPIVDGLDVASAGELDLALASGAVASTVSFAGPGKSANDLQRALRTGVTVNVESGNELRKLAGLAAREGRRARAAIRVNPDFELKTSGMKMAGGPKQFGVDAEIVPELLACFPVAHVEFVGFHIFSGSQNLSASSIVETQNKTLDLALQLAKSAPMPVRLLNIGGGFGIPYFPNDQPLDLEPIGRNLATLVARASRELPDARLVVELGRYIVGEAGIYVCRVVDRKVSRGQVFLVTDGGLHHHLAASGNFGQVLRKNYPVVIATKARGPREIASVVGPLCTPLDLLADRAELATAEEGDLVVVLQSGAYGLTASPTAFLSHPSPREELIPSSGILQNRKM
jgi:diaminopimelate decarboxylase